MANENLKAQKIYGKYIKDLPQVTEVNDTDDLIIEDSTPITSRVKLGVLFDAIKKRIASTWKFEELNNQTIVKYASELNKKNDYDPTVQTYSNNGWDLTYRHIDHNHIYVEVTNTTRGGITNINDGLVMAGIPFDIEFSQMLPIYMQVANVVVGYGRIRMGTNHGAYLVCTNYSNDVSLAGFGILTIKS